MLEGYSKRQLSFQSDRLPALSGLASFIAEHKNGNCFAGIYGMCWEEKLVSENQIAI
jgi:hypothetical protein